MKNGRVNIGSIRRTQIVDAAAAVIAEQGIQNLSLSEIESKVGMSRGQLTYYYKTKDDILLAVFDRMLQLMCEQHGEPGPDHPFNAMDWLEVVAHLLDMVLQDPPGHSEFHALQYTFLSQISHREDFRRKLAELYEEWRGNMAEGLKRDIRKRPAARKASPRALATLVQAMLHGLAMQKAADPHAIDTREIAQLCLDVLGTYVWNAEPKRKLTAKRRRKPTVGKEVAHERNGK
ncbi:MAG TPA: TetR/AcrR family transcriptional regulator [Gemmataceae bacterium]|nr:TetR/AcrR family transcriptional regulator [Gemmataceae bacterium]